MLCSHFPINDSSGCLHITVYLAVKLQVTTKSQKVHISSHDVLQKSDMRRCCTPQNFLFAFIDELWKTKKIIILEKCWKKKKKKKKILEISSFYTWVPKTTVRDSTWDPEWHNFFCNLEPFLSFEKKKKASGDVIILNLCNKK